MIKQVLCALWGHVWKMEIVTYPGKRGLYVTERCTRCQAWKR